MVDIKVHAEALTPTNDAPTPYSEEAKIILNGLRPHSGSKTFHTAPRPRIPETNRHGLVVPPRIATFDRDNLTDWQIEHGVHFTEHHLHWTRKAFDEAGSLAREFRDHSLNRILLPNFQHVRYHRRHDPFVVKYRDYLIPSKDVMITFLDEASTLEMLGIQVRRLDQMMEGIEDFEAHQEEDFEESVELTARLCTRAAQSEIVFPSHVQAAVFSAQRYVPELFE